MSRFWHQRFALATRQDLATLDEDHAAVNGVLASTRIIGYCVRHQHLAYAERFSPVPDLDVWTRSDLSMRQFSTLLVLWVRGPLPMGVLAETVGIVGPSATGVIKRLRARGLAELSMGTLDERLRVVSLTDDGTALVEAMTTVLANCEEHMVQNHSV